MHVLYRKQQSHQSLKIWIQDMWESEQEFNPLLRVLLVIITTVALISCLVQQKLVF